MASDIAFHSDIMSHERRWIILNGFLKESGYELRARYQPGWVPSWTKLKYHSPLTWTYEDGEPSRELLVDAVRVSDSALVMLKMVNPDEDPSEQHDRFFTEEPRGSDPQNHCLPLLDVLRPSLYPSQIILVYPFCVSWNVWPFVRVSEAVEFFTQIFEGLAFMHKNNFTHLDASDGNIVMAGLHLYKESFHPRRPATRLNSLKKARHIERYQSDLPVKYFFIDFETSIRFESPEARRPVSRQLGRDKTVPEERAPNHGPSDPFALDIYCVGNMIVEHWLKAYRNVEFIRPLAMDMVAIEPARRPSADEVMARFQAICDSLSAKQLQSALVQIPEYHSAELRGHIRLAEHRKRKKAREKALAASRRAARDQPGADRNPSIVHRLGDLLTDLFAQRDKDVEDAYLPKAALREARA